MDAGGTGLIEGAQKIDIVNLNQARDSHTALLAAIKVELDGTAKPWAVYDQVASKLAKVGLQIEIDDSATNQRNDDIAKGERRWVIRLWVSSLLALVVILLQFSESSLAILGQFIFAVPIQCWVAAPLYKSAYNALVHSRRAEMDFLIVLSTSIAFGYSTLLMVASWISPADHNDFFFETTAVLITLIVLGRWMERWAKKHTTTTLTTLKSLHPHSCLLVDGAIVREIDVRLASPDDFLQVLPGEKVPLDGFVSTGSSEVDESMITGESYPVLKCPGSPVVGGTQNKKWCARHCRYKICCFRRHRTNLSAHRNCPRIQTQYPTHYRQSCRLLHPLHYYPCSRFFLRLVGARHLQYRYHP